MSNRSILAQEGRIKVLIALIVALFFMVLDWDFFAFVAFMATAVIAFWYRNPEREVRHFNKGAIASVCDGKVVGIKNIDSCNYFDGPATQIEIDVSLLDVGFIRAPFDATVTSHSLLRGVKLNAYSALASKLNEQLELSFTQESNTLALKVIAQPAMEPFSSYVHLNSDVMSGSRVALCIHSLVIIYLPQSVRVNVNVGDTLKASDTLLGYFA